MSYWINVLWSGIIIAISSPQILQNCLGSFRLHLWAFFCAFSSRASILALLHLLVELWLLKWILPLRCRRNQPLRDHHFIHFYRRSIHTIYLWNLSQPCVVFFCHVCVKDVPLMNHSLEDHNTYLFRHPQWTSLNQNPPLILPILTSTFISEIRSLESICLIAP